MLLISSYNFCCSAIAVENNSGPFKVTPPNIAVPLTTRLINKNFEAECATSTTMARRGSGAYLSDSISRLNPNFAHSSNRPQYYTYMRVLMTSTFLSHQCAESYPKNRGLLNRTVIQNNGKFLPLLRLHGTTAAPPPPPRHHRSGDHAKISFLGTAYT